MATYDLAYPGAAIDAILNTAYFLQEAGYIFQGSASEYSGTPSKRVWLIAPAGFTGLGIPSAVPHGSIGICLYNGTAWVGKVINVLTLDSAPTRNSQNGVTSGGVAATLDEIAGGIMETFASLLFDDETAAADLRTKLSYAVKFSVSDVYQTVTHLNILAATTSKAGLMSAEDKAKVDSFLTGIRSMQFVDATSSSEQAIKLVEQLKWTVGGVQEVIDSITLLAATSSKAGLLSASDKAYIDALPATLTNLSNSISGALALMQSLVGYYVCDTAAGTAAKTVDATGYSLTNGGCIRIKMTNANTADNVTLNINSTGAQALYYDGAQASFTNTWEAGEVLEVYYDGTQYQCASGGGGKFATGEKVKETRITAEVTNSSALPTSSAVFEQVMFEGEELFDIAQATIGTNNRNYISGTISNNSAIWTIIRVDAATGRQAHITLPTLEAGKKYNIGFDYVSTISVNQIITLAKYSSTGSGGVTVASVLQLGTIPANSSGTFNAEITYNADMGYLCFLFMQPATNQSLTITNISISSAVSVKEKVVENAAGIAEIKDDIYGYINVDMSLYAELGVWISDTGRKWASSQTVHCKIIPCFPNKKYKITVTEKTVRYCFLKSDSHVVGEVADTCTGYGSDVSIQQTVEVVSPSDANYIYFLIRVNASDFILPSKLEYLDTLIRPYDDVPTKNSTNGITSGAVDAALSDIRYYGSKQKDILSEITESMWARTTWNGSSYTTSGTGATILFPAEMFSDGEMQIKYLTSDIAVHLIKVADGITSLANGTSAVITKQSGYISAVNGYKMVCNGDFNRIAIQIKASTASASSDIARLQNLIVPVAASETPINKKVLADAYNASLDTLRFRFPTYNAVRYPYTGERIFDKTFSLAQMGNGVGNQGSCCYNGVVFGFSSNSTTVKIYDMVNDRHTSCSIANMSPSNSHNNSAFFTDEFYAADDPFPIIGTSDDINKNVLLFRIAVNNGTYSMTLVQTIHIEKGETAFSQGNTYTYGNGKLFSLAENSPRTHWYVYEWPMPSLAQGDVTLTSSSENEHMIAEVNNYQGMCYKDGYMFMPEKTSNSNIIVVNMATDEVITHIPVSSVMSAEIEDIWFYYDKLYFTTVGGLIYKIDLY